MGGDGDFCPVAAYLYGDRREGYFVGEVEGVGGVLLGVSEDGAASCVKVLSFTDAEPERPGMTADPLRDGTLSSGQRMLMDASCDPMWPRYISNT